MILPAGIETTPIQAFMTGWKYRFIRFRRKWVPYLIWHGQPVYVRLTFTENRLCANNFENALSQLDNGVLPELEHKLRELGIKFDRGLGPEGRDWELDWSLKGPIQIMFTGKPQKSSKWI